MMRVVQLEGEVVELKFQVEQERRRWSEAETRNDNLEVRLLELKKEHEETVARASGEVFAPRHAAPKAMCSGLID
jgi:hypothetical protein